MSKSTPYQLASGDCSEVNCNESLSRDDVIAPANNDNRIVFASLYTYADEKDESAFKKILLPPICVPTLDLFNMFYVNKRKSFSPYVLNVLVGALNKPALIEEILQAYEDSTGNSRSALSAQQKIMIRQELSVQKINNRVQRIAHLNYDDFQEAFKDEEHWFDEQPEIQADEEAEPPIPYQPAAHKNLSCVEISVYSESLQMGFNLIVQFISWAASDIEWPAPFAPGVIRYDALAPTEDNSLACNMCVTYEPINE
jgi:hypothetical protein